MKTAKLYSLTTLFACVAAASQLAACGGGDDGPSLPTAAAAATTAPVAGTPTAPAPAPVPVTGTPGAPVPGAPAPGAAPSTAPGTAPSAPSPGAPSPASPAPSVPSPAAPTPAAPTPAVPNPATPAPGAPSPAPAPGGATPGAPTPVPAPSPLAPAPGTPAPPTSGGDCNIEGSVLLVPGNTVQTDTNSYSADGKTLLSKLQNKTQITGGASFRQESGLIEQSTDTTVTYTNATANGAQAGTTVGPSNFRAYSRVVGSDSLTYGLTTSSNTGGVAFSTLTYYTPALSGTLLPALNTVYARNYNSTTTVNNGTPQTASASTRTTFLGVEQISVPAGTFVGCKIKNDVVINGFTATFFSWTVAAGRLKGVELAVANADGTRTSELNVGLLNGQ
jgi:hypothetical protein